MVGAHCRMGKWAGIDYLMMPPLPLWAPGLTSVGCVLRIDGWGLGVSSTRTCVAAAADGKRVWAHIDVSVVIVLVSRQRHNLKRLAKGVKHSGGEAQRLENLGAEVRLQ